MSNKTKAGFTLIELLVVVLIIGILAAVAVPQYQKAVEKSRLSEALLNISTMQKQLDLYVLENGYAKSNAQADHIYYPNVANVEIPGDIDNDGAIVTQNFTYYAGCGSNSCAIEVVNTNYSFQVYHPKGNSNWTRECWDLYTSMGKYICEGLTSQGWTHQEGEY